MSHLRPILVFSFLLALPALADDAPAAAPTPAAPAKTETAPNVDPGAASMLVTKDAVTGKLRPATPVEREKLLGRTPLASPEPQVVSLPSGALMLKERPEDANYAVVTRRADGTLSYSCVHGADAARAAVASAPTAPTAAPKNADR
ncbi:MAG TPA: hypothetical protein VMV60_05310 [Thermoanaerobaculia bacterium]|nr:hypothetical protein [Thermoanaerobaculia bacterium]